MNQKITYSEVQTFEIKTSISDENLKPKLKYHQHELNRGQWKNKREFLFMNFGYCIGIGTVCRFPYLCYKSGGGAFLVPFLLMLVFCGIPLYYMELCIGQFSSTGCIGMFRMSPIFKGAGYAMLVVNGFCVCYYSMLVSYPITFLSHIFDENMPWSSCDNEWNTGNCSRLQDISKSNFTNPNFKTPADEFFHLELLKISGSIQEIGSYVWPLFFSLLFTWIFVYFSIFQGVESIGKVIYVAVIFPFVTLCLFFIRGITLPGAMEGIKFYIYPQWGKLLDLRVWTDAAMQIFFGLGPGWGGIINMASFNDFRNDASWDSIFIPIINAMTSIFAGIVVFSIIGYLSFTSGLPVESVASSGPGLAFCVFPEAIAEMPIPKFWAVVFFFMLFLLGVDSVFVQIEAIVSALLDEFKKLRPYRSYVTLFLCTFFFSFSSIMTTNGGMFVLTLLDWYSASIPVILICFCEIFIVSWVYGLARFVNDIYFMIGKYPSIIWQINWKYVTPILLLMIFITSITFNRRITYNNIEYPDWAIYLGWCACLTSISCIPLYMLYIIITKKGKNPLKKLIVYSKAFDWTPAYEQTRIDYEQFVKSMK